jgi:hypothetical protein
VGKDGGGRQTALANNSNAGGRIKAVGAEPRLSAAADLSR